MNSIGRKNYQRKKKNNQIRFDVNPIFGRRRFVVKMLRRRHSTLSCPESTPMANDHVGLTPEDVTDRAEPTRHTELLKGKCIFI